MGWDRCGAPALQGSDHLAVPGDARPAGVGPELALAAKPQDHGTGKQTEHQLAVTSSRTTTARLVGTSNRMRFISINSLGRGPSDPIQASSVGAGFKQYNSNVSESLCDSVETKKGMRGSSYNHLYYFWTVAREGGVTRAADVLHLTPQTISSQLKVLEDSLGVRLFARSGRKLVLTDAGRLALSFADEIFRLGTEMSESLKGRASGRPLQLSVGVVDVVPKLVAYRLLEPALHLDEPVRILCREGKLDTLLADIAVHKLDMVLADTPLGGAINVRAFNHPLGECGITFFAAPGLAAGYRAGFPGSLRDAPMLVPAESTALRGALMHWFDQLGIRPQIVGEFEDRALMHAFGQSGVGVFMSPSVIDDEIAQQHGVAAIGSTDAVRERYYAISTERRLRHAGVVAVSQAARPEVFAGHAHTGGSGAPQGGPAENAR
jgi:LysR family transcriptional activator of nhaA